MCGVKNYCKTKEEKRLETALAFAIKAQTIHVLPDGLPHYGYFRAIQDYLNAKSKVPIFCFKCWKYFYQRPNGHLNGKGCPICADYERSLNHHLRKTTEQFIIDSILVHGEDKFGLEKVVYINGNTPVEIYCKICCRYFSVTPNKHLKNGYGGCDKCYKDSISIERFSNDFKNKGNKKFDFKFNYENIKFIRNYILINPKIV